MTFPAPSVPAIVSALYYTNGRTRKFRKSPPQHWGEATSLEAKRAYYVWRLARFHGGVDLTLPMTADVLCRNDPWVQELDQMAGIVARKEFGSEHASEYRWGQMLGSVVSGGVPSGGEAT